MSVTHDDVRNIAALARLAVSPERVGAIAGELNGILAHMDALARVNVDSLTTQPVDGGPGMRLADDQGPSVTLVHPPSAIAPEWRDGFFLVPRLATHGDAGASDAGASDAGASDTGASAEDDA